MAVIETENPQFAIAAGGPAYRFYLWTGLADEKLARVNRRVFAAILITWLPLLILTAISGVATGDAVKVPFLYDLAVQVKFLVAVPIFIAAEHYVQNMLATRTVSFFNRGIVREKDLPRFREAVEQAHAVRNSWTLEIILLVLVFTAGLYFWRSQVAFDVPTWYAHPSGSALNLTTAGWWNLLVCIPLTQFLSLRWYVRFFIWFWFLRQVSKLDLKLIPSHPDRAGGLGFLGKASYAFGPILFAQGAVLSGTIATAVIHNGAELMSYRIDALLFIIFFVVAVLSPLFVFIPDLVRAKRRGLSEFGALASRYTAAFEEKWIQGKNPDNEPLMGTADIQSLADLGNSYAVVKEMNMAPFVYQDVLRLAASAAVPLVPLALLVFSPEELVEKILNFLL